MTNYETKVSISAPIEQVYDVISDYEQAAKWITGLIKVEIQRGNPKEKGCITKYTFEERGKEVVFIEELLTIKPYSNFSFLLENDQLTMETETHLKSVNSMTQVIMINSIKGKGFIMRLFLPFMKGTMIKRQTTDLNRLKDLIETQIHSNI